MRYRTGMTFGYGGVGLTPVVKNLLIANVAAFLLTALVIPASFTRDWLAFQPTHALARPWGAVTYMFVHADPWHLLGNMLVLFFCGTALEGRWGSKEFFRYYLVCGLGGAALSFLLARSAGIEGASAACFGLMVAFAMAWPDARIYVYAIFPVPARVLMGIYLAITVFSAFFTSGGGIAHMAHLGGALAGLLYLKADWRPQAKIASFRKSSQRAARRLAIVPRDEEVPSRPAPRPEGWRTADEGALLDAVDRVLDKISAEGMSALTPEERGLLDEVSRRHRASK